MTEKELLYLEDAVEHENSIIKICEDLSMKLENNSLKDFINCQITNHEDIRNNVMIKKV